MNGDLRFMFPFSLAFELALALICTRVLGSHPHSRGRTRAAVSRRSQRTWAIAANVIEEKCGRHAQESGFAAT
jgi:hypothetical protein